MGNKKRPLNAAFPFLHYLTMIWHERSVKTWVFRKSDEKRASLLYERI